MYRMIRKSYTVYIFAACVSLLFSYGMNHNNWIINPDAICYLISAETMSQGLHTAMNICGQAKWPLYSLLIAKIAQIGHLSFLHAAYLLNSLLTCMTVLMFIRVIALLNDLLGIGANKLRLSWFAATIILLANELNAVRPDIIRDHGYWAFYLLSIFLLLKYFHKPTLKIALSWSVSIFIATLFRIEGIFFLVFMPFVVWLMPISWLNRCRQFLQLNVLAFLAGLALASWFLLHPDQLNSIKRLDELYYQLSHGLLFLSQRYYWQGSALITYVLGHGTAIDGAYLLFITLFVWYITIVLFNLTIVSSLLLIYAFYHKIFPKKNNVLTILKGYILINVIVTLAFLGENMFLSGRYVFALSMTLMLWLPFALNKIWLMQKQNKKTWPLTLAIICLCFSGMGGIFDFGYSKKYIYNAGNWLAENVPKNTVLYTNDFQVMYYSHHFGNQIFAASKALIEPGVNSIFVKNNWKNFDFIALRFTKKDIDNNFKVLEKIKWQPIAVFQNRRGDCVLIYSTAHLKNVTVAMQEKIGKMKFKSWAN